MQYRCIMMGLNDEGYMVCTTVNACWFQDHHIGHGPCLYLHPFRHPDTDLKKAIHPCLIMVRSRHAHMSAESILFAGHGVPCVRRSCLHITSSTGIQSVKKNRFGASENHLDDDDNVFALTQNFSALTTHSQKATCPYCNARILFFAFHIKNSFDLLKFLRLCIILSTCLAFSSKFQPKHVPLS